MSSMVEIIFLKIIFEILQQISHFTIFIILFGLPPNTLVLLRILILSFKFTIYKMKIVSLNFNSIVLQIPSIR